MLRPGRAESGGAWVRIAPESRQSTRPFDLDTLRNIYHTTKMRLGFLIAACALAGIAVETAIVMLIYIDHQMRDHWPETFEDLLENVRCGAIQRLRPKLMTVSTIILGLIPIFLTEGPGSDVMRRIALPMVGGMVSTTILTLILIPVLYAAYMQWKLKLPEQSTD